MNNKELEKFTRDIFPEKKDYEIPALLGFARKIENLAQKEILKELLLMIPKYDSDFDYITSKELRIKLNKLKHN